MKAGSSSTSWCNGILADHVVSPSAAVQMCSGVSLMHEPPGAVPVNASSALSMVLLCLAVSPPGLPPLYPRVCVAQSVLPHHPRQPPSSTPLLPLPSPAPLVLLPSPPASLLSPLIYKSPSNIYSQPIPSTISPVQSSLPIFSIFIGKAAGGNILERMIPMPTCL